MKKHNELRSKVANGLETRGNDGTQPKASNMMELVWNDELAEVAQRYQILLIFIYIFIELNFILRDSSIQYISLITLRWADQCKYGHDDNRRTKDHDHVGQNVARQQNCDFASDMDATDT